MGQHKKVTAVQENEILVLVTDNPKLSSKRLLIMNGVTHSSVFRIFYTRTKCIA